ncbi:copper homeostasis protein CutC [Lactobacillus pasteurii]|uniref:PF03932 family protein CutC n=1 Tax=Lactobacillus pasteurii DSM 23907 = CRBIP 24.76 TaxID=1423790 RepID=I7KL02_9LACO|nr:copper homeostasis protein CutC [Lactobacillus pasteurii]TDG77399.1 hypothetical protein C5L33_000842 [Lactobacillus pasteurii]CCI84944.1 Copper homeostasis protein CutC [Lactobacillus pasteurii DSM 23907 = CRBIP 24.76]
MIKEVCVKNFTDIPRMIDAGANRIELNNDLAAGGTTPSFGVIKQSVKYAHNHNVPVVVMIRPRGGNFVYSDEEFEIMENDLQSAGMQNVDGVAFGCLTADNKLDKPKMVRLCQLARELKLDIVLHMAFDEMTHDDKIESLDWLKSQGVKRILTHGGALNTNILDNADNLRELIAHAKGKIDILPGGGITAENYQEVIAALGVDQVHGTKIVSMK